MAFIHLSKAVLREKSTSLIIVIVQTSNVLSPAILRFLPLKGTSITPTVEAGRFAALIMNLDNSETLAVLFVERFVEADTAKDGKANSHSNRFGLAAPPINLDLKSSRVLELKLGVFLNAILGYLYRVDVLIKN